MCNDDRGIMSIRTVKLTPVASSSPIMNDIFSPPSEGIRNTREANKARRTLGMMSVSV